MGTSENKNKPKAIVDALLEPEELGGMRHALRGHLEPGELGGMRHALRGHRAVRREEYGLGSQPATCGRFLTLIVRSSAWCC